MKVGKVEWLNLTRTKNCDTLEVRREKKEKKKREKREGVLYPRPFLSLRVYVKLVKN